MSPMRALVIWLALGTLAACQPGDADFSDRYRPGQLERGGLGTLLSATPEEVAQARARDRAIYAAELQRQRMLAGSLAAQQSARRGARIGQGAQALSQARQDLVWAERKAAQARRDLRAAERLDRRRVGTDVSDRADARRRLEQFRADRAQDRVGRLAREAALAANRLDLQSRADAAAERLRVMGTIESSEAARARAERRKADPLYRYLPYRRRGESIEALRDRVAAAEAQATSTGAPVETILQQDGR